MSTRATLFGSLLFALAMSGTARAEILIQDDYLLDTATNLRWTGVQIPTATFRLDSEVWTIADLDQFTTLVSHIGPAYGEYSPQRAQVVDWLGATAAWVYGAAWYEEGGTCTGANDGGNCYAGIGTFYQQDERSGLWLLAAIPTASLYGPNFALPHGEEGWQTQYVSAFAVTPVPLPASVYLLATALLGLCGWRKRQPVRV